MVTTSLKLPDELKENIRRFAAQGGTSPHAFMLATLESEVRRRTLRATFLAQAQAAAADIDAGGPVYALDDVHVWVKAKIASRASGKKVKEPKAFSTRGATPGKRQSAV